MSIFDSKSKLTLLALAMSVALTGCLGGSGGSNGSGDGSGSGSTAGSTGGGSTGGGSTGGGSSVVQLHDETWDLGNDRLLGLARHGSGSDTITILKGTPKDGQDGDIFSVRSAAPDSTVLAEIKNIDNLNDTMDYADVDTMEDYVVLCQDGSNTSGYTAAASLQIFKRDDPSKVVTFDLTGLDAYGRFEMRDCHSIDARFTGGTSTAYEAVIYTVGNSMMTSGSPMTNNDRVVRTRLTIDKTVDVDASGAIALKSGATDNAENLYKASGADELAGIAANNYGVYFTLNDSVNSETSLLFMNPNPTTPTISTVTTTETDAFTGLEQMMRISDIAVIESSDYDLIYMTSNYGDTGIVMAAYDRSGVKPARTFAKSTDTLTERCEDRLVLKYNGNVGDKMWCHDATDKGNILELNSPVYP
ncbi:hypothetical protein [Marinospirillum perlucidum]|uniref:hypothetical protein n=1 Tax=Marinospirillum perlucidum TaxID=1982602 RepID=UPI000DF382F5|nr:hypothetical protein [Marinospirillum perlucidum]